MSEPSPFAVQAAPDWRGLLRCIRRQGTPERVYHIELFLDPEVQAALSERFGLTQGLDPQDPFFVQRRHMALQRQSAPDTASLQRSGGRSYVNEHRGPITTWADFDAYPWPDPHACSTRSLEWYETHLPDDMCVIASGGFAHLAEYLIWLMGYETLCYALYDQRDLVAAISARLLDIYRVVVRRLLAFERVKVLWGSDDLGYRSGTLISPEDLREFVLPGHKVMAAEAHRAGRPYLFHSCGNLSAIMDDLIDDVGIDAKHSFEDTIEDVRAAKSTYGRRIALLGGIDMDFLCRAGEQGVRQRVRETLDICLPGGGYCLGSGNSIANYVPLDNYLAMLDEGRRYAAAG